MRSRVLAIISSAAFAVSAVGCGAHTPGGSGSALGSVLIPSQLERALIQEEDLPPGWGILTGPETGAEPSPNTAAPEPGEPTEPQGSSQTAEGYGLCPSGVARLRTEEHNGADILFANPDIEAALNESLISTRDAPAHFSDVKRVFDSCVGQTWTEEGDDFTLISVGIPKMGDRSIAYQLHETMGDGDSQTGETVFILRGTVGEQYSAFPVPFNGQKATSDELSVDNFLVMVKVGDQRVAKELANPSSTST